MKKLLMTALLGGTALTFAAGAQAEGTSATGMDQSGSPSMSAPADVSSSSNSTVAPSNETSMTNDTSSATTAESNVTSSTSVDSAQLSQAQEALQQEGYKVSADGMMGPKTQDAIRSFQQANNLTPSGQLDSQTLRALNVSASGSEAVGAPASPSSGSSTSTSY